MENVYSKFELTKNNHLQYYYNNNTSEHWRSHSFDIAHMTLGGDFENKSFVRSLIETANTLYLRHKNEFCIFLSGGLDSEVACRIFSLSMLKYQPIIIKFKDDKNIIDVSKALKLCNELEICPKIIDFDPVKFFIDEEWKRIAVEYQAYTFYQQLLLYVAEQLQSPMITIDEIEISKQYKSWTFSKKEDQDGCWHRFIEKTNIPAYNNFYTYDPATIAAFLDNQTVTRLVNDEIFGKLSWSSSKHQIYTELTGWKMNNRTKITGMENMMYIWTYVEEETSKLLNAEPQVFTFDVNLLKNTFTNKGISICNIT